MGVWAFNKYTELKVREIIYSSENHCCDKLHLEIFRNTYLRCQGPARGGSVIEGCQARSQGSPPRRQCTHQLDARSEQEQAGDSGRLHQDKTYGCPWGHDIRVLSSE